MKRIGILALALLVCFGASAFAQNKTSVNIQCNEAGAQVYFNERLAGTTSPNFSTLVPPGQTVVVRVSKVGFKSFETTIRVGTTPITLNAQLQRATAPVVIPPPQILQYGITVNANVQGADVIINGNPAGRTPFSAQVPQGSYTVLVRAPGYLDYSQNVVVNGPVQVNANLQPLQATLSVTANVQNAEVLVNGNPAGRTPFSAQVPQGSYTVLVRAPGYRDYSQNVLVSGPVQVNATLQALTAVLSVTANVQNAEVLVNGNPAGRTPFSAQVPQGSYTVLVRAPGYRDYSQNVLVSGPVQVNAILQANVAAVTINANVLGADVVINEGLPLAQRGKTPFTLNLPLGNPPYTIKVSAPGYSDFFQTLAVTGPASVNAVLQPLAASFQVAIPDAYVNKDAKGGHWSQIMIYVDGVQQRGSGGQLLPGRHVIRVTSGGMAVEAVVEAQAGRTYVIEPFMGISVK